MPAVVTHMTPTRYAVTIFDQQGAAPYDGMASVAYHDVQVARREQVTAMPAGVATDGFGRLIQRSDRLECTEQVIVGGPGRGGHKVVGLLRALEGSTPKAVWRCWLDDRAPTVADGFAAAGGLRYVVSVANQNDSEPPWCGVEELWYRDEVAARRHLASMGPDALADLATVTMLHGAEVVGIAGEP